MDINFTARMETKLDDIAEGGKDWRKMVGDFYYPFIEDLKKATGDNSEATDIPCESCGNPYVKKKGRFGEFLYCTSCKRTRNLGDVISEKVCPNCGEKMIFKEGKYGKYYSCPNPSCNTKMQEGDVFHDEKCPECNSLVFVKTGRFGKYLKCSKCNFTKSINELQPRRLTSTTSGYDLTSAEDFALTVKRYAFLGETFTFSAERSPFCRGEWIVAGESTSRRTGGRT